jgi:hypothetical protein
MENKVKKGWKSDRKNVNLIVGSSNKPTEFESGQVIINKKATKKNLEKLIEINNDGLEKKTKGKVTNDATDGGLLKGKPHYDESGKPLGGIPGVVDNVKPIETEGEEFVLNKEASEKHWKELSKINTSTGGVPINPPGYIDEDPETFKDGGNVIEFNPNHLPNKAIMNYANEIRTKYPSIWKKGGNIFGNQAFKNLMAVRKRGYWLESEEWMYIKWRSYVARHIHDFRIAGVIAMLKWGDKVEKGFPYMRELVQKEIDKIKDKNKPKLKYGGQVVTYKQKYNKKYGYKINQSHSLEEIAKDTGISLEGLQQIYNKGIGAYKTNPKSVRPTVKSKEQWAMGRVYSAVMGGDAAIIDKNELKMNNGGNVYIERFIVKPKIKFGLIVGYVVYDTIEKTNLPYEFDEEEKVKAQSRADLSNALYESKKMVDGGNTKNEIMNKNTDAKDTVTLDIPLMIRMLELSREDIHSDAELHHVVERLLDLKNKPVLTMDDYEYIADIEHKHIKKMALGGTLETDPQKLISKAHYNLTVKRGRKEYAPSAYEIQEEIDRMVMEQQFGSNNI